MDRGSQTYHQHRQLEARGKPLAHLVLPIIGKKKVNTLTDRDLQTIINKAAAAGKSRKTLQLIASDLRAFCKYCRKAKLSTFLPEDVQIPASARYKARACCSLPIW